MRIAITRKDGGVSIMTLVDAQTFIDNYPEHTDAIINAEIQKLPLEQQANVASWRVLDDNVLPPSDRSLRGTWVDDGKLIKPIKIKKSK